MAKKPFSMMEAIEAHLKSNDLRRLIYSNVVPTMKESEVFSRLPAILEKTYEFPYDDFPVVIELSGKSTAKFAQKFKTMFKILSRVEKLTKPVIAGGAALRFLLEILEENAPLVEKEKETIRDADEKNFASDIKPGIDVFLSEKDFYYSNLHSKIKWSMAHEGGQDIDIWDLGSKRRGVFSVSYARKKVDIIGMAETSPLKLILDFDLPECRVCIPLSTNGTKILTTYQSLRSIFTDHGNVPAFLFQSRVVGVERYTLDLLALLTLRNTEVGLADSEIIGIIETVGLLVKLYGIDFVDIMIKYEGFMSRSRKRLHKYDKRGFHHLSILDRSLNALNTPIFLVADDNLNARAFLPGVNPSIVSKLYEKVSEINVTKLEENGHEEEATENGAKLDDMFEIFRADSVASPKQYQLNVPRSEDCIIRMSTTRYNPMYKANGQLIDLQGMKFCNKSSILWFFKRCINGAYYQDREHKASGDFTEEDLAKYREKMDAIAESAMRALEQYEQDPDILAHNQLLEQGGMNINKNVMTIIERIFLYE